MTQKNPFPPCPDSGVHIILSENAHSLELNVRGDKRSKSLEVLSKIDRFIREGFEQTKTRDYNELFADFKNFHHNETYDDYYLLFVPLYQSEQVDPKSQSINFILPKERETIEKREWDLAYEILCHYYKYIYFRVEENPYETLHLENMSFQRLMNKDILADIEDVLNSKNPETRMSVIQSINDNLSEYLDNINATLKNTGENFRFTYKRNQPNKITARHLREIVISCFLSVRTLKSESKDLQDLSSGEQRQALIKVASTFIKDTKDNLTGELILAIDEPENSLHIKNLYYQFNSLISLHQYCQVIMVLE